MPTTLNLGVAILDVPMDLGTEKNPQDAAQVVTDTGWELVTDTGVLIINNGEQ